MECKIGKRIFELRKEQGLSQQKLAEKVGVTQKAIDFWEKGINEPKASYILKLSEVLNITESLVTYSPRSQMARSAEIDKSIAVIILTTF